MDDVSNWRRRLWDFPLRTSFDCCWIVVCYALKKKTYRGQGGSRFFVKKKSMGWKIRSSKINYYRGGSKLGVNNVHRFARLGVQRVDSTKGGVMVHHGSESSLVVDVKSKEGLDPILMDLKESVLDESTICTHLGLYFNRFSFLKCIFCANN
ncbi:hypothetical protein MTR67_051989 [Solanum verrucosum]|uniref:Uncharacterized protein n=1 Tax=Solanum verrucosum TaxID=315347 RepID=A0AAF0V7L2_SOLVR|nr:hypothetical protein MTR67_051989 [Solanum verrucosum]